MFFPLSQKELRTDSNRTVMSDWKLEDCLRRHRNNGNATWPCFIIHQSQLPFPTAKYGYIGRLWLYTFSNSETLK